MLYKVLIVEDEAVIRKGLRVLVSEVASGFTVIGEAENGQRALDILNDQPPDVLITDIRMPKVDGINLIEKAKDIYPSIPIIIISGYDDFEYAKKAIKYGVEDYLLKPINRVEFVTTMEKVRDKCNQNIEYTYNFKPVKEEESAHNKSLLIKQVQEYVLNHMENDITLQAISIKVNAHPNYISQLFKDETGQTFSEFVRHTRITRAKQLLKETNLKNYEIARLCGFQSDKYFTRIFKKSVGKTPRGYRLSKH